MKNLIYIFVFITLSAFSQNSINNYKYIIVPKQLEIVNKPDKYQTSSLTKFLFNKYGYTAFIEDESFPNDLAKNRCLALTADAKDNSGMFTTKTQFVLKDCNNKIVYTSKEGKSKEKDYKKAYHEVLRKAFKSVKSLNYSYKPLINKDVNVVKNAPAVVDTPKVIEQKAIEIKNEQNVLYAQPIKNGYQLVNTKPETVFKVLETNLKDVFVLKNKKGILYKSNNNWFVEYYINGTKRIESLNIKF